MLESRPLADGVMMALRVRRRTVVAGCRATWPDHPGYAGALRTVPPTLPWYGSIGLLLAVGRQAFPALENLALI